MQAQMTREELVKFLAGPPGKVTFVMLTGADASGKSTLAKALVAGHDFLRYSRDKMAEYEPDLEMNGLLEARFYERMKKSLNKRRCVVDDNMNLTEESRSASLKLARKLGVDKLWIVRMDVSLEQALEWNKTRKVRSFEDGLIKSWRQYQRNLPQSSEGPVVHVKPTPDGIYTVWRD